MSCVKTAGRAAAYAESITLDECNQSDVQVVAGKVKVQDLVSHKTKILTAGHRYTAKRH